MSEFEEIMKDISDVYNDFAKKVENWPGDIGCNVAAAMTICRYLHEINVTLKEIRRGATIANQSRSDL